MVDNLIEIFISKFFECLWIYYSIYLSFYDGKEIVIFLNWNKFGYFKIDLFQNMIIISIFFKIGKDFK